VRPARGRSIASIFLDLFGFTADDATIAAPGVTGSGLGRLGVSAGGVFGRYPANSDDLQAAFHSVDDGGKADLNACISKPSPSHPAKAVALVWTLVSRGAQIREPPDLRRRCNSPRKTQSRTRSGSTGCSRLAILIHM
jgi:hypothetical protein